MIKGFRCSCFIEKSLSRFSYPMLMVLAIAFAFYGFESEAMADDLVLPLLGLVGMLIAFILERVIPYRPDWQVQRKDLPLDLAHFFISGSFPKLIEPLFLTAALAMVNFIYAMTDMQMGSLIANSRIGQWHPLLQLVPALVLGELGQYIMHWAEHKIPLLWYQHEVHHSTAKLNMLRGARTHFIGACRNFPIIGVLLLFGFSAEVIGLVISWVLTNSILQHSNIRFNMPRLFEAIFSASQAHRIHHDIVKGKGFYN